MLDGSALRPEHVGRLPPLPEIALAKEKLRWEPTIPLREGLIRTIDYFRSHLGVLLG
jgi:nucleoside-diphosphate-sugar epimerase